MDSLLSTKPTHTFFNEIDIKNRFNYDISEFKDKNTVTFDELKHTFNLKTNIDEFQTEINSIITEMQLDNGKTYIDKTHSTGVDLNKLWILRSYLFANILLMTILIVKDTEQFNTFSTKCSEKEIPKDLIGEWNSDIVKQLQYYKLGIFGSMDATSDIDLSLQYCNPLTETQFVSGLMYINRIIENIFLAITGFTSLDFDIECYGTIIFQFDNNTQSDVYYLDCNQLNEKHYKSLLKYAFASIYRNYYKMSNKQKVENVSLVNTFIGGITEPIKIYSTYNSQFYTILKDKISDLQKKIINNNTTITINNNSYLNLTTFLKIPATYSPSESVKIVDEYATKTTYDEKRRMYYNALQTADAGRETIYKKVQLSINTGIHLTSDEIMQIIIGEATFSLYREESYLLAPTIMHVVRTLQLKSDECKTDKEGKEKCILKYQTQFPDCKNKGFSSSFAYCDIGKYGYFLSVLEQIGYMWRFYNQYCNSDTTKCKNKLIKYGERFSNGIIASMAYIYPTLFDSVPTAATKGGTRKKNKKRRITRKQKRRVKSNIP